VSHVFEADIRSYFTRIDHQWLRRMVAHRIADPIILRLISKWLKAGALRDGVFIAAEEGTPQGGPISPVLSNVYLHFTLDLWFEKKFKSQCRGEAYLVRFADDFVGCFQFQDDAQNFQRQLRERFARFNLELAEDKTRLLLFGRFAAAMRGRRGLRPETLEFLGFKHVCGVDRRGRFALIRIPSTKSCRKFLARTREWLLAHRHWKRREQQHHLMVMLRGFYQYFALHHCERKLSWIRYEILRQWKHALQRRGQRRRLSWERLGNCSWFELPFARNMHPTV
jgi:group II intron reverse transcriptase/maturase